ncbi:hypothetical protein BG006_003693 [Podila minutissima]|uniref:Uncharacterized protein n=1 Tax=Podila minutissima TaxID=64525 RepID=A0A9P5SR65_9FUNG|nr:hypothetical protein BG006_003693 [Podila minutissima]
MARGHHALNCSLDITVSALLQNSHLLTTNPDLTKLMLSPGENADYEDIHSTLESTLQLTDIHLNNFVLTRGGQLGSFLINITGLKVLALAYIKGITGFEGCQVMTGLSTLVLPLSWIYQTLLRHAKTLELVSLILRECPVNNVINTGKLLAKCPNLQHVQLIHDQYTEDDRWDGDPKDWFKHWNCSNLLNIELRGFSRIGTELQSDNEDWTDKEDWEDSDLDECEDTREQKQRVGEHGGDSGVKEGRDHSPEDQELIDGIYHEG